MKYLLLTATAIFFITNIFGQTSFARTYGNSNNNKGYSVAETFDGGYIISALFPNELNTVIKTNSEGDTMWTKDYPFLNNVPNYYRGNSIIQTSDSNFALAGASPDSNAFVLKINSIGDSIWFRESEHFIYPERYTKIIEDNLGDLILIGSKDVLQSTSCCAPILEKMNSQGDFISEWAPYIECPSSYGCRLKEIFIDNDGNYLISGLTLLPYLPRMRLTKVNPSGIVVWNKYYLNEHMLISGITQDQDGGYLIVGDTEFTDDSTRVYKTDIDGNLLWLKKYKGNTNGWQGRSIDTTNGGYLIAGDNGNITLMKIDLNYNLLWSNEFGGPEVERLGLMKSTDDGGCIMVGSTESFGAGAADVYLIKTGPNGEVVGQNEILEPKQKVLIYPNPFSEQTTLIAPTFLNNVSLTLYSSIGKPVKIISDIEGSKILIKRDDLPSGLYFIRLAQNGKTISTDRLVIIDNQ